MLLAVQDNVRLCLKGEDECIDIGTPENYAQTCEEFKGR